MSFFPAGVGVVYSCSDAKLPSSGTNDNTFFLISSRPILPIVKVYDKLKSAVKLFLKMQDVIH